MRHDELKEAKRRRAAFDRQIQVQLQLIRKGKMETSTGPQLETDTTEVILKQAEQSKAALDRKIARLGSTET